MKALLAILLLHTAAIATTMTLGSTFNGQLRTSADSPNVNLFSQSSATVTFSNSPSPEFTATLSIQNVPVLVSVDFHGYFYDVSIYVTLVNSADRITVPALIFIFDGLQFTPAASITGANFDGGTPGVFGGLTVDGAAAFHINTGPKFLSNGGSYAGVYQLTLGPAVPEPATAALCALALAALALTSPALKSRNRPDSKPAR